jgi:hypothetical protein
VDLQTGFYTCTCIQIAWIVGSAIWFWRRSDEFPLILSLFLFYVFAFRFWALLQGWTTPVNISPFGFSPVAVEGCLESHALGVLGQTTLLGVYMLVQKRKIWVPRVIALTPFLQWLRTRTFVLAVVCAGLATLTRRAVGAQIDAGKSMGFEISSYMSLFPMVLISAGILLALLWKAGGLNSQGRKFIAVVMLAVVAYLTFDSSSRFQFLGWILASTIILTAGLPFRRKALFALLGLTTAAALFAVAGALRGADDPDVALQEESVNRFAFAADANMLDGFVLLRQVYPDILNYSYGLEHLEIFTRPIPRAWWPAKPVGGYLNKLGIIDASSGVTLGISPSLFGSFYQEGGIPGLVLLSAVYGFLFGWLIRFTAVIHPLGGLLIRAIACAAVVPLLRGGDLPGIYAWFGMAFWPCFLVLYIWRKELLTKGLQAAPTNSPPVTQSLVSADSTR